MKRAAQERKDLEAARLYQKKVGSLTEAGRAQLGGGGKWFLSLGRRRPPSKGKGVLEPDDRDKEDLQLLRSQPLQEAKTLQQAEATDLNEAAFAQLVRAGALAVS